jgi:hypothetical protein
MWRRWGFLVALAPLSLASGLVGHRILFGLLPPLGGALAFALLRLLRGDWKARLAAVDLGALLALDMVVVFYAALGDPTHIPIAPALALLVGAGTCLLPWTLPAAAQAQRIRLRWADGLAFVAVALLFLLFVTTWAFGTAPGVVAYAWLASMAGFRPVLLLALLCLWPGRWGWALRGLALLGLELAAVWHVASIEVMLEQAHPLFWDEALLRLREPGSWRVLLEGLLTLPSLGLALAVFGGVPLAGRRLAAALTPEAGAPIFSRLLCGAMVAGQLLVARRALFDTELGDRYLVACSAPWSPVHGTRPAPRPIQWEAAAEVRRRVAPPVWEAGADPVLSPLAGRYRGRSVVLVILESQRASDIAGLGEGAFHHAPLSPRFSGLARDGVLFTNYVAAGTATSSALWTILTGLPLSHAALSAVQQAPEATRLGRLPDFAAAGYAREWLCPASPRFDNWDALLGATGTRSWIDVSEVRDLPREAWTSWGMPDEQLYALARARYDAARAGGAPVFVGLLTVSNHPPYRFPPRPGARPYPSNHQGGMLYADQALGDFVDGLRRLPVSERPVIFVTADTSNLEGLLEAPLGVRGLEALRIPGLLILPDGALAGERYAGVFAHEDLLDLLYLLVVGPSTQRPAKFVDAQRRVAAHLGTLFLSDRTWFDAAAGRWMAIADRWRLVPDPSPVDRERLEDAWREAREDDARLWPEP